jgi:predicted nucleotidyltransferase
MIQKTNVKEVENIMKKLKGSMSILREKYNVKNLEIFGSYVRGEQKKRSDLDILVEFTETIDLFKYIELENYMGEILGVKVDLVMKDTLKPRIKDRILNEAIPV